MTLINQVNGVVGPINKVKKNIKSMGNSNIGYNIGFHWGNMRLMMIFTPFATIINHKLAGDKFGMTVMLVRSELIRDQAIRPRYDVILH